MPRRRSLITVIRELVQTEVSNAMRGLLGGVTRSKGKPKNGRRRRRRRRGPGHPLGSKNKAA